MLPTNTLPYQKTSLLTAILISAATPLLPAATATFNPVNYGAPSTVEQESMDRINNFRADPQGHLYDMFVELGYSDSESNFDNLLSSQSTHTSGWWTSQFGSSVVTTSMDFYGTVPSTLYNQFQALPSAGSLSSYTWSDNIGWAADQYAFWVEMDGGNTSNPHAITGAPGLGDRFTLAGSNWTNVAENIAPNWPLDSLQMHMGFAIDWGTGTDGIQSPAGHRNSMLSSTYDHFGIGTIDAGWDSGRYTEVQHFAREVSTDPIFYGYVSDLSTGEILADVEVEVFDEFGNLLGSTTTNALGAYTIQYTGGTPDSAVYTNENGYEFTNDIALGNSGDNYFLDAAISSIPEPSSAALILSASLLGLHRRRNSH